MPTQPTTLSIPVRRLALLLGGLAMFGPFSIDTIFPAFPAIGAQFGADKLAMQQTISVYLVAYALMSIVHGPLSDAYGRRRIVLWGVVGFTLSSLGCVFARTIEQLLFWRTMQGVCTGAGLIVGRAIVRDLYEGPHAQKVMSLITLFFGVAPVSAVSTKVKVTPKCCSNSSIKRHVWPNKSSVMIKWSPGRSRCNTAATAAIPEPKAKAAKPPSSPAKVASKASRVGFCSRV